MSDSEKKLASSTKLFQSVKRFAFLMKLRELFYFFDSTILFFLRKQKKKPHNKKQICILLLPGMGDCIIFCRLAESLKKALPSEHYDLTILTNDTHIKLLSNFFDHVIGLPFYKMSFNPFARIGILSKLRRFYFDEFWDLNGCGECTPNLFISKAVNAAEKKVAYPGLLDCGRKKSICPAWMKRKIYTEIVDLPVDIHLLTMFQKFLQHVTGRESLPGAISLPMQRPADIPEKYIIFVPSGSHRRNMWGAANFIELGKRLFEKRKLPIILCGAAGDEPECSEIEKRLCNAGVSVINLAGKTSFEELTWLLRYAEEIFTIDTGSFHLAVALETKTTVIAPDAVFSLYVDYPPEAVQLLKIIHADMDCKDCGHNCYDSGTDSYPCIKNISLEGVYDA